jgi:hypothetical protein
VREINIPHSIANGYKIHVGATNICPTINNSQIFPFAKPLFSEYSVQIILQIFYISSVRQIPRKLALLLLKEARVLGNLVAKVTFLSVVEYRNNN